MTHAQTPSLTPALMAAMPLTAPAEGVVPDWIHLLPAGAIQTQDGRGPYSAPDLAAIVAASGGKLPIDENHAIDLAAPEGRPSPARGHIVELQARADGLWGRVEWTASGRALMADRAYLGVSPVIAHDPGNRIHAILRASLTNHPNLKGLTTLHHQENRMSLAARLAQVLGLDAATGDDTLVDRITSLHQAQTTTTALHSSLSRIGVALGVTQDAQPDAIEAAAKAAGKTGADLVPALQAENATLKTRLDTLETDRARDKAVAFVDGAKAAGSTAINQGNRDEFIAMHMQDATRTEKLVNSFPKLTPGAQPVVETQVALQSDSRDLTARARKHQAEQRAAGVELTWTQAVLAVSGGAQ